MSQLEKLKALKENQQKQANNNLALFQNIVVLHVGVDPTQHYPKLKDKYGKMVKIVLPEDRQFEIARAYKVAGLGYDIKSANMIFIEQKGQIADY